MEPEITSESSADPIDPKWKQFSAWLQLHKDPLTKINYEPILTENEQWTQVWHTTLYLCCVKLGALYTKNPKPPTDTNTAMLPKKVTEHSENPNCPYKV